MQQMASQLMRLGDFQQPIRDVVILQGGCTLAWHVKLGTTDRA